MAEATLNIGLSLKQAGEDRLLDPAKVVDCIRYGLGVRVRHWEVRQSDSEPTVVATLVRPLTCEEAYDLAVSLRQECIAQRVGHAGSLHGPCADAWAPFNPAYFLSAGE